MDISTFMYELHSVNEHLRRTEIITEECKVVVMVFLGGSNIFFHL